MSLATVGCGVYDRAAGTLTLASAGHLPPLGVARGGEPAYLDVPVGPPLGALDAVEYATVTVPAAPGSTLLREHAGAPLDALTATLVAHARSRHDDVAVPALRVDGHA